MISPSARKGPRPDTTDAQLSHVEWSAFGLAPLDRFVAWFVDPFAGRWRRPVARGGAVLVARAACQPGARVRRRAPAARADRDETTRYRVLVPEPTMPDDPLHHPAPPGGQPSP